MSAAKSLLMDLLVIGTGPAASTVANKCASAEWRVAIAEKRKFGGTCALRGCNPKKIFVRAAELTDWARRCDGKLVRTADMHIDWPTLVKFKRSFTDPIPAKSEAGFREKGITTLSGAAQFLGPQELRVGDTDVRARHVLIAAGARPATLEFDGCEHVITSDAFMELEELPKHILFVGGGYISFEFAHVAARAGCEVTIVDHGARVLKRFSAALVDVLIERSRELGIEIRLKTTIESIAPSDDRSFVVNVIVAGETRQIHADLVVHGAGRVPNLDGMNLPTGEVEFGNAGVKANEYMQSVSNAAVYAAGDCADSDAPPLTPVANEEGRAISRNLLKSNRYKPDYGTVPSAVFTVPALASVGLTVSAARKEGRDFELLQGDMSDWSSVKAVCEPSAAFQVLIERPSGRLLGAHLLGPRAEETINLFAMAMKFDLTANDLKSVLMTFPTFASDVREMI